jgi:hypothetical protein
MGREWKKASVPSFISAFTNSTIRIDTGTRTEETHRQMQKISHLYEQVRILIPPSTSLCFCCLAPLLPSCGPRIALRKRSKILSSTKFQTSRRQIRPEILRDAKRVRVDLFRFQIHWSGCRLAQRDHSPIPSAARGSEPACFARLHGCRSGGRRRPGKGFARSKSVRRAQHWRQ